MTGANAPEMSKIRRAVSLDNSEASAGAASDVLVMPLPARMSEEHAGVDSNGMQ